MGKKSWLTWAAEFSAVLGGLAIVYKVCEFSIFRLGRFSMSLDMIESIAFLGCYSILLLFLIGRWWWNFAKRLKSLEGSVDQLQKYSLAQLASQGIARPGERKAVESIKALLDASVK